MMPAGSWKILQRQVHFFLSFFLSFFPRLIGYDNLCMEEVSSAFLSKKLLYFLLPVCFVLYSRVRHSVYSRRSTI